MRPQTTRDEVGQLSRTNQRVGLIEAATNETDSIRIKGQLKPLESCMQNAVFSFQLPQSYPPTQRDGLLETCKRHSEAFKCLKERSKTVPTLIRRGVVSLISNRQRANKRFCTNLNSEQSKRVIQDFKCIMEKRFAHYQAIDAEYSNTLNEIERRNYNDSARELKQFCCATYKYKRESIDGIGKECPAARQTMSEIISSTVPNDINLICDDEDKLAKICTELEPIKVSKVFDLANSQSPAITVLYLIATLGEAE